WFKPFALTIACSVAVSLFVSFSLDPMLSAYWADPHKAPNERGWITRQLDRFNHWFNERAEDYKRVIAWALDHRAAMMMMAALTFFASFLLPSRGLSGLAAALVGIAIVVFAFTRKRLHWLPRTVIVIVGLVAFVMLPQK